MRSIIAAVGGLVLLSHSMPGMAGDSCPGGAETSTVGCVAKSLSLLESNRAYYARLLAEYEGYMFMDLRESEPRHYLPAYSIYMELVEQFARVLSPDQEARVRVLNSAYERQIEITEMRVKGRGNIADHLERTRN